MGSSSPLLYTANCFASSGFSKGVAAPLFLYCEEKRKMKSVCLVLLAVVTFCVVDTDAQRNNVMIRRLNNNNNNNNNTTTTTTLIRRLHNKVDNLTDLVDEEFDDPFRQGCGCKRPRNFCQGQCQGGHKCKGRCVRPPLGEFVTAEPTEVVTYVDAFAGGRPIFTAKNVGVDGAPNTYVTYNVSATFAANSACNMFNIQLPAAGSVSRYILYACADDIMTVTAKTTKAVTIGSTTIPAGTACTNKLSIVPDPTTGFPKVIVAMGGNGCALST